ncbi:MAG: glycosyltransferase family 4 protein, partial [Alphaproteobacteria bacterium]
HEMAGTYPLADSAAFASADAVLAGSRRPLVVDGLALPAFRLRERTASGIVALVHHPLAEETGLAPGDADRLRAAERADLARVDGVVVTSAFTARALAADYGVSADRIAVVPPGVDLPEGLVADAPADGTIRLLSVAALVPRKAHRVLLEALHAIADFPWSLTCIGADDRDSTLTKAIRTFIVDSGLSTKVDILGEVDDARLAAAYASADAFVHPALYEGYGMAVGDALAAGLPVIATSGGAIPDTVPQAAGLLVPPGDVPALAAALRRIVCDVDLRRRLAVGAKAAGRALPRWPATARSFAAAVGRLAS